MGIVTGAHGTRGEGRVKSETDFEGERFETPGERWVRPPATPARRDPAPVALTLDRGRNTTSRGRPGFIVKFRGVNSRNAAERLRGSAIVIKASERAALAGEHEFYAGELIGLALRDGASGEAVGVVRDIYSGTGTYDTLLVRVDEAFRPELVPENREVAGRTLLVPFAREIVPEVDLAGRTAVLLPPPGLYDLIQSRRKDGAAGKKKRARGRKWRKGGRPKVASGEEAG